MALTIKPACSILASAPAENLVVVPGCSDNDELEAPILDIQIDSAPSNIVLEWTDTGAENYQLWKSINGGEFELITVIGLTTHSDSDGEIGSGDVWCYKVRGVIGETASEFSNIVCAVRDMIYLGTSVSETTWIIAFGDIGSDDPTLLTDLNFAAMKRVTGNLFLDATLVLTAVNHTALQIVDDTIFFSLSGITSISLPALTTINGGPPVLVQYNGITPEMLIPAFYADSCGSLTTISFPNLVFENGNIYAFDGSALSAASVQHILARAKAAGVTHCFITLDGGTNAGYAALSLQGQTDYDDLIAAGNSVSINP
jgi:hypothetical protein